MTVGVYVTGRALPLQQQQLTWLKYMTAKHMTSDHRLVFIYLLIYSLRFIYHIQIIFIFTFQHFIRLYLSTLTPNSTKGKSEVISMAQFVQFMNEKQRDPRMNEILYPLYDEKRCTEIINDYELNEENKKAGAY